MEHIFCDVLVVGSGAAGLRAAISAKQKGLEVCVISKQSSGKATCTILSAGVFAGTEDKKSSGHHLKRILQALFTEIYKKDREVFLDLRKVSKQQWAETPFSASSYPILGERYGANHRPVRIAPMAHHTMGGACIDVDGTTSLPGLFAAGEVTGGLHGANRMGGNALTETLVFGVRAGDAAANWAKDCGREPKTETFEDVEVEKFACVQATDRSNPAELMADLSQIVWKEAGIIRNQHGLEQTLSAVNRISAKALQSPMHNPYRYFLQQMLFAKVKR